MTSLEAERHYFVDEAGDLTLFNRAGRVITGTEGCSRFFILGVALVADPHRTRQELISLRTQLIGDPYLQSIPSVQTKTTHLFHGKDDCPEVRREVFKYIAALDVKFYAIVRRKSAVVEWVHKQNIFDTTWWYNETKLYDACVKRLFKDRLHRAETNFVIFARRGKSSRNKALALELEKAKHNFMRSTGQVVQSTVIIGSNSPTGDPCLQVIDYGLWALQRLYERHEDRYFNFLRSRFCRIIDLDDKRQAGYGIYYDDRNPLTLQKIQDSLED